MIELSSLLGDHGGRGDESQGAGKVMMFGISRQS